MDPIQSGMDYSESSDEELSSRRKIAKSPSLSTITEETLQTSQSPSSTGSGSIDLAIKSKIFSAKRRLFESKEGKMEVDLSSSGYSDSSSPTKNQIQKYEFSLKREVFDPNLEKASCSKTGQKCKGPLKEQNQPAKANKRPLKTKDRYKNLDATDIPSDDVSNAFDKLFVCGIFNTVKPSRPTAEELQIMYINNSSDDDEQANSKKRRKLVPAPKKKPQSKLRFKKIKTARNVINDSESDSDF